MFRRNFSSMYKNTVARTYENSKYSFNKAEKSCSPSTLLRFDDTFCQRIRDELKTELQSTTIKLQTFPRLSKLIRGFRPGELTIFTGPTGSGKTTVLSQMSLDYCFQGIKTLWGSFEIKHTRLARIMIQQVAAQSLFHGENENELMNTDENNEMDVNKINDLRINEEVIIQAQKILNNSPIFFMDQFGSTPLETVLELMNNAVHEHQIQHIVLDNLQFMLSGQYSGGSFDKFDLTDRTVSALRSFATNKNVHITLVIHPRKEMDDTPLGLASVSGTAKATQEADNVIILQKIGDSRYLDVKKNRFDGLIGSVPIKFDHNARLILETNPKKSNYHTNEANSKDRNDNNN